MAQNTGNSAPCGGRCESDFEVKNLLIDLVCENPLIYDKSHPGHFRANMRNGTISREFYQFQVTFSF